MGLDQSILNDNQAALSGSYEDALGSNQGAEELQKGLDELFRSTGLDIAPASGSTGSQQGAGVGAGHVDTSLDDIFGTGASTNHSTPGATAGNGGVKPDAGLSEPEDPLELGLQDGFDVDQFPISLLGLSIETEPVYIVASISPAQSCSALPAVPEQAVFWPGESWACN